MIGFITAAKAKPKPMSRAEFIDHYMRSNAIAIEHRRPYGFKVPDHAPRMAVPCYCRRDSCLGWKLERVAEKDLADSVGKGRNIWEDFEFQQRHGE